MNILIIEDSKSEFVFLSGALRRALDGELSFHHTETLCEGLQWLQDHKKEIDLIFLDLGLPDTDDHKQAFKALQPHSADIPIIISTGDDNKELAKELLSEGAADYIVKGSGRRSSDLLQETVEYAISRHLAVKKLNDKLLQDEQSIHWLTGGYSV